MITENYPGGAEERHMSAWYIREEGDGGSPSLVLFLRGRQSTVFRFSFFVRLGGLVFLFTNFFFSFFLPMTTIRIVPERMNDTRRGGESKAWRCFFQVWRQQGSEEGRRIFHDGRGWRGDCIQGRKGLWEGESMGWVSATEGNEGGGHGRAAHTADLPVSLWWTPMEI
ncbi:hypothetical protein B0T25DRAFT_350728 [Lasiosphaeria hispida]|uniref:Uncharacterized protein n=1 Tax=Lasiosphaeria hispida TaxID=260671 RepID=A0AAJ0M8E2_9PEZI|nr:hypothetical protein B0T25DRAFT_350728 [Lasiosphaeria hispida]